MLPDVSSLPLEKTIAMAMKSEKEAEAVYAKLHQMVKNFVLKDKLQFLIQEEKKHQKLVLELYHKLFQGSDPAEPEKSVFPRLSITLTEETSIPDLLETAMEAEKTSEEFYDLLSDNVEERGAQEILRYLASMEHSHYFLLKGDYELALRDEMYTQREEFQVDMVHVGP
jgi:rubrerythrin